MKLSSHIVEKPWGKNDLPSGFANPNDLKIGEIWFDDDGAELPLLVKWLFTSEKLSVQVHPNDNQAKQYGLSSGKEECWLIVDAQPDATIGLGTLRNIDAQELRALSLSGEIESLIDWKSVKAGDYYYVPAGTVHAIGGGVTLIEVQQNADITYRLYDYGRPRELHLKHGVEVSKAKPYDDERSGRLDDKPYQKLASGAYFNLFYARGKAGCDAARNGKQSWLVPFSGTINGNETLKTSDCGYMVFDENISVSDDCQFLIAQAI